MATASLALAEPIQPISPIQKMLTSRKFMLAVLFLVLQVVLKLVPDQYDANVEKYFPIVVAVVLMVTQVTITVEDSLKAWSENRPGTSDQAVHDIVDEVFAKNIPMLTQSRSRAVVGYIWPDGQTITLSKLADGTLVIKTPNGEQSFKLNNTNTIDNTEIERALAKAIAQLSMPATKEAPKANATEALVG